MSKYIEFVVKILCILVFSCLSLLHAGDEQIDIMNKEYTDKEVEDYFAGFEDVLKNVYLSNGAEVRLDIGTFTVIETLGSGQEGRVYLVENAAGEQYALKLPLWGFVSNSDVARTYIKPLLLLKTLDHANVIKVNKNSKFMLMEKADGTVDWITTSNEESKGSYFNDISEQVINAMEYLQQNDIHFNDLHANNITFVLSDDNDGFQIKLIDINGVNDPKADTLRSLKSFVKRAYRIYGVEDEAMLESIDKAESIGELRSAVFPRGFNPNIRRSQQLIGQRKAELNVKVEQMKLKRQGRILSRRQAVYEEDDVLGAVGGCD